jgi:hypothetical protein
MADNSYEQHRHNIHEINCTIPFPRTKNHRIVRGIGNAMGVTGKFFVQLPSQSPFASLDDSEEYPYKCRIKNGWATLAKIQSSISESHSMLSN